MTGRQCLTNSSMYFHTSWHFVHAHFDSNLIELLQADKSRVKDYINRLDNFDGPAVGEIAVGYEMFEEAFEIYKKFGLKSQAIRVLLDHQADLDRAFEYAGKVRHQPTNFTASPYL